MSCKAALPYSTLLVLPVCSFLITSRRFTFPSLSLGIYWKLRDLLTLGLATATSRLAARPLEAFSLGMYLKHGYTITSRGCHNHCWFCSVPKREGTLRELPITDGWIILDDNLLCYSEKHIRAVFDMLKRQKHRPDFRGGIEAKLLKSWHIDLFKEVKPKQIFFAYDTPDDLPPLEHAARLFKETGYGNRNLLRCYVLIGYPGDSFDFATKRLETVKALGFCPMAMLYMDFKGDTSRDWRRFQRSWARPAAIYSPNWHNPLQP